MPHITVRNDTQRPLHAGFNILGMKHPSRHNNALPPGASFDGGDFPSFVPQSLEVRAAHGQGFHDGETLEHGAQLAAAGGAGSAAVGSGIYGAVNGSPAAIDAAGVLWKAANDGTWCTAGRVAAGADVRAQRAGAMGSRRRTGS